jgi:molybdate transport system substrate-binding protein
MALATAALAALLGLRGAAAGDLTVAAASDLQTVLPSIVDQFQAASGQRVRVAYGSSGQFVTQIQNGAPFDVFLSADVGYVSALVSARLADGSTVVEYATGRLALWTRHGSGVDLTQGLRALTSSTVRRVSIANPQHAPYGRAAIAGLQRAGVYESVVGKIVMGENVSQAAQFAASGNADAGIIALSTALAPALRGGGVYVEVPADLYPAIRQGAVVLARTTQRDAARAFLAFLRGREAQGLLQQSGFGAPR